MKLKIFLLVLLISSTAFTQNSSNDGDWSAQEVSLSNTPEADFMIRIGDIDNLNYGWPEDFNPFSGMSSQVHDWPYNINPQDISGTDRVMIPTGFIKHPEKSTCLGDGYSSGDGSVYKVVPLVMNLSSIKNANIQSAALLMFVDDFQSPSICSKFRVWFNGKRFSAVERILDGIDQSGPVGKMIFAKLPADLLPLLKKDKLVISIDDSTTFNGDGYAIDFVKLLINPKPYLYTGGLNLIVLNSADGLPISGAKIVVPDFIQTKTNSNGEAILKNLPAGLVAADFSAEGFITKTQGFDVITNQVSEQYQVYLDPIGSYTVQMEGETLTEGESLILNNIQFKVGSAELLNEGKAELDKVVQLMRQYPQIEIELSGHTSSEGEAEMNRKLSLRRVESCRKYLSENGISEDRISTVGYGPDRPIAPNDNEANRSKNRRVELKITRIQ